MYLSLYTVFHPRNRILQIIFLVCYPVICHKSKYIFISQLLQDYFKRIGLCHFYFAPKGVGVLAISQQLLNGGCWRIPFKFLSHVATQTFPATWNLCLIVFSIGFDICSSWSLPDCIFSASSNDSWDSKGKLITSWWMSHAGGLSEKIFPCLGDVQSVGCSLTWFYRKKWVP